MQFVEGSRISAMWVFTVQMACSKLQSEAESCMPWLLPGSVIQVCGVPNAYGFAPPTLDAHPVQPVFPEPAAYCPAVQM